MTTYTEGKTPGDWLLYEAQGTYSRSARTIGAGGKYESGTVLGEVTATRKLVPCNPGAADGSETASAILLNTADATGGDMDAVVIDTHAQVNRLGLSFGAGFTTAIQRDAAMAQLRAAGIKSV